MNSLIKMLAADSCRGVARSQDGRVIRFTHRGVADLFSLVTENPSFLDGASVADRVIGRGAALLLVLGGVANVYAQVISKGVLGVLSRAGISVSYGTVVPHIINRAGTGICPVEQLTAQTDSPEEAYVLIKQFIESHATSQQNVSRMKNDDKKD